jgi:ABC-2 type transport system permease protein
MRGLVAAERRKLTSVVTTWVLTGIGLLLTLATASLFTFANVMTGSEFTGSDADVAVAIDQIGANSVIVLVVALLAMTTEFRHGTAGRTFQVTPSRTRVLAAKMLVGAGYATAYFVAGLVIVAGVLGTAAVIASAGLSVGPEAGTAVWHGLVGLVLTALLGVAIGALIRSQVVALTVMLVWVFVVEGLIGFAAPRVAQWLPFTALNALFVSDEARQGVPEGMLVLLDPAVGLATFLAYVLVTAAAAVLLLRTRDI